MAHDRNGSLTAQEHRSGVDAHHGVPLVKGHLLNGLADVDAGVVDKDVHPAGELQGLGERLLPVGLTGEIGPAEPGLFSGLNKLLCQRRTLIFLQVQDENRRPFLGKQSCHGGTQSPRSAGDENCFSGYIHIRYHLLDNFGNV